MQLALLVLPLLLLPLLRLFNVDAYGWDPDSPSSLYASMPFLFATHAGGSNGGRQASAFVFLNSAETFFRVNYEQAPEQKEQKQHEHQQRQWQQQQEGVIPCWFCSEGGEFECLLCCGPSPVDVHRQVHVALGLPMLAPIGALGKHQSRWGYAEEVRSKRVGRNRQTER